MKFKWSQEQEKVDQDTRETPTARTATVIGQVMNKVEPELRFTTETEEEFGDMKLPTLDYKMWVEHAEVEEP